MSPSNRTFKAELARSERVLRRAGTLQKANEVLLKQERAALEAQTSALRSQLEAIQAHLGASPANSADLERELKALTDG